MSPYLQHGLWVRKLLTLVDLYVSLQTERSSADQYFLYNVNILAQGLRPNFKPFLCYFHLLIVFLHNNKNMFIGLNQIPRHLEILHKISAGDFAASNLLLHQFLWSQQERNQLGQLPLKITVNI